MNTKNINPYVTTVIHGGTIYYGILKIRSKEYITLYNLMDMNEDEQNKILALAETWWWQSNRSIPISVFMSDDLEYYNKHCIRFNTASVIVDGPNISLNELPSKRIKRRNQTLKKKK